MPVAQITRIPHAAGLGQIVVRAEGIEPSSTDSMAVDLPLIHARTHGALYLRATSATRFHPRSRGAGRVILQDVPDQRRRRDQQPGADLHALRLSPCIPCNGPGHQKRQRSWSRLSLRDSRHPRSAMTRTNSANIPTARQNSGSLMFMLRGQCRFRGSPAPQVIRGVESFCGADPCAMHAIQTE
jgi:hypothetical protein